MVNQFQIMTKFDKLFLELYTGHPFDNVINQHLGTGKPEPAEQEYIQMALETKENCWKAEHIVKRLDPEYSLEDWVKYQYELAQGWLDEYSKLSPREIAEDFILWSKELHGKYPGQRPSASGDFQGFNV